MAEAAPVAVGNPSQPLNVVADTGHSNGEQAGARRQTVAEITQPLFADGLSDALRDGENLIPDRLAYVLR
jgi:hypothetical protein